MSVTKEAISTATLTTVIMRCVCKAANMIHRQKHKERRLCTTLCTSTSKPSCCKPEATYQSKTCHDMNPVYVERPREAERGYNKQQQQQQTPVVRHVCACQPLHYAQPFGRHHSAQPELRLDLSQAVLATSFDTAHLYQGNQADVSR